MKKFFKLDELQTTVRTEVVAGITTFLSMVYILAVNPNILQDAGLGPAGVFTATAVSAAFATLIMAFLANYPVALASGMGLNAYFTYSVCVPMARASRFLCKDDTVKPRMFDLKLFIHKQTISNG